MMQTGQLPDGSLRITPPSVDSILLMDRTVRNDAVQLDPLRTEGSTGLSRDDEINEALSSASTLSGSPFDLPSSSPSKVAFPLQTPKSFRTHRGGTATPDKQALAKGFISRTSTHGSPAASIAAQVSARLNSTNNAAHDTNHAPSPHLFSTILAAKTPATAKFASLKSPCLFHQGFDEVINADRVMEEIAAEDDGISHSRLLQTATSVREISKQLQRRSIKRVFKTVMIITKARDNSLVLLTRELAAWLLGTPRYGSDLGVTVYVDAKLKTSKRFNADSPLASNPRYGQMLKYWTPDLCYSDPEQFDLVLTLGGDGTVLFTSYLFQKIVPPVMAFSLGSLGFLTNFEFDSFKKHLDSIMGDNGMRVNLRMRFTCTVFRAAASKRNKGELVEGERFEVLNELVIDRGPSSYISQLELLADDEHLTTIQADGCIFSTPTGSTAYSLSAGGPLTHPSIPGILLTPICPHTLSFRPMVLSDSLMLKVCVPRNSRSTAYASFDGKGRVELRRGDCVQVEAGRYPFPTVVSESGTGGEWFESVRRALGWGSRGAIQKGFVGITDSAARSGGDYTVDSDIWRAKGIVQAEEGDGDNDDEAAEVAEEWDIDADPESIDRDSGIGLSEVGSSVCASPTRNASVVVD